MLTQSQLQLLRGSLKTPGALWGWEGLCLYPRMKRPPPCLTQTALALQRVKSSDPLTRKATQGDPG